MKPYIDSLDEYYSIDHNEPEEKPIPKYGKHDALIGKISIIVLVAYAIYLISRWLI